MRRLAAALVLASAAAFAQVPRTPPVFPSQAPPGNRCEVADDATVARLRDDIAWLADDARMGREPGTDGNSAAERWLVERFTALGLEPAGADGYRQPFRVEYGVEADASSQVLLRVRGETHALALDRDFAVAHAHPYSGNGRAVGALVYVGHALVSHDAQWDDLAHGVSLRGRIAVALSGAPHPTDPARADALQRAHIVGSLAGKVRAARQAGAVALIQIELDASEPLPGYIPAPSGGIPVVRISRAQGRWLLGRNDAAMVPEATPVQPTRIAGATARVVTATRRHWVTTSNVLGVVRARVATGDGGVHTSGAPFVVGAHYDHIGHGGASSLAPGVYAIHNGADDNASGTAAVLELARRVARAPLSRDVVFALFTAEELGLVGSRWLVQHRTPGLDAVAAMMNLDMVGRLRDCRLFVESRETAPGFTSAIDAANRGFGFDARPWEPARGSWGASDQMSFLDAGVPAVFLFTGLHDDYHRPSDDAPTLNHRGLGAVVGFGEALLRRVAEAADRDPGALRFVRGS